MKRLLLILLLAFGTTLSAQTRPTVGVVLSGGGAKGFAHIGVLEILDSLGIPVDAIGGTSMGSIIGGLYAIGHTPSDLAHLATETEWDFILNPKPDREYLASYEKNTYERYLLTLDVTSEGLKIPGGLNPGERIINILSNHTVGYHGPLDFKKDLPIPFVCIATELNTGDEVVMDHGILPLCMRASMSLPTLFSPFYYEGDYLIDGGTVNNFPADHLREMGADILIGVDVQTTFKDTLSDPTFLKVLEKTGMYMNAHSTREREALCDLILSPDMAPFGVTSFEEAAEIIESGRQIARDNMEALLAIRDQLGGPQPRTVDRHLPPHKIAVDQIRIKGLDHTTRRNVIGNLGFYEGDTVTYDQINEGMLKLHGTNLYSLANYLTYEHNGQTILELRLVEKPSMINARFGIRYDSDFETAALLNFTIRNLFLSGSYASADIALGNNPRVFVNYIYDAGSLPGFGIDYRYWNYASDFNFEQFNFGEFRTSDSRLRLYMNFLRNNTFALKLGGAFHATHYYSSQALLENAFGDGDELGQENLELFFNASYDNRNRANFSTKGSQLEFQAAAIINTKESVRTLPFLFTLDYEKNVKLGEKWTLRPSLFASATLLGDSLSQPNVVNLGGVGKNYINLNRAFYGMPLSYGNAGYATRDGGRIILAYQSAMGRIDLQYEVFKKNFITAGFNAVYGFDDFGSMFESGDSMFRTGYKVEYGLNTIAGPISVCLHKSLEEGPFYAYLNVGYWF